MSRDRRKMGGKKKKRWAEDGRQKIAPIFFFEEDGRLKKKKRWAKDGRLNFQKNGIGLRSKRNVSNGQILLLIFWRLEKKTVKKRP